VTGAIVRSMHHKIFLVPFLESWSAVSGQREWAEVHAPIWLASPGLCGYVQNRPVAASWNPVPTLACAEDWFSTRDDERALHETTHYREAVLPDEERLFKRANAWVSTVSHVEVLTEGALQRFRVLSFGGPTPRPNTVAGDERLEIVHVRRDLPLTSSPHLVSAWASTIDLARGLAARLGGFSFVTEPVVMMAPPVRPWSDGAGM
jgi:hypothetical protein